MTKTMNKQTLDKTYQHDKVPTPASILAYTKPISVEPLLREWQRQCHSASPISTLSMIFPWAPDLLYEHRLHDDKDTPREVLLNRYRTIVVNGLLFAKEGTEAIVQHYFEIPEESTVRKYIPEAIITDGLVEKNRYGNLD